MQAVLVETTQLCHSRKGKMYILLLCKISCKKTPARIAELSTTLTMVTGGYLLCSPCTVIICTIYCFQTSQKYYHANVTH